VSETEYLDMIAHKTGALIARSIGIGALFGGADDEQLRAFERYGALIGRIFQVRDDVLGVWGDEAITGKSATSDIRRKKQTLPVVYTLGRGTAAARELATIYAKPALEDDDVARAVTMLDESGALEHCTLLAERTFAEAREALAELPVHDEARSELDAIGRFLLEREK
jgi:geranylgeranyl diphosphate synthase, type I